MRAISVVLMAGVFLGLVHGFAAGEEWASQFEPGVRLQSEGRDIDTGDAWAHSGPALADIDADGKRELVVGDFSGRFRVFSNVGTEAVPKWGPQTYLMAGGEEAKVPISCCIGSSPYVVDYDGDGVVDMLSGSYHPGECYLFRGLGKGQFAARETLMGADGKPVLRVPEQKHEVQSFGSWPVMVDWEADGDLDLLVGGFDGTMFVRLNERSREQPELAATNTQVMVGDAELKVPDGHAAPAIADWDGDGLWDILAGSADGGVYWYRNVGSAEAPTFAKEERLVTKHDGSGYNELMESGAEPVPGIRSQIAVTDYDGDGRLDLLVGDFRTTMSVRSDLTAEESAEFKRVQSEQEALFKESSEATEAMRKAYIYKYPGDAAYTAEAMAAWQLEYKAFSESDAQKARAAKGAELAKSLEGFLVKPENPGDFEENATTHGYVWLYVRK